MANIESKNRIRSLFQFGLVIATLILVNLVANSRIGGRAFYGSWDLTEDKRFTLTDNTKQQLDELEEVVFIRVLLSGELPAAYQRLQNSVRDLLEDFRGRSTQIEYEFSDPLVGDEESIKERQRILAEEEGIVPIPIYEQTASQREVKVVYPFALVYYGNRREVVNLLENETPGIPRDIVLNKANALLEYKFSRAIDRVVNDDRPLLAFTTGHGELPPIRTADLERTLREQYQVGRLNLDSVALIPQEVNLLMIAKPTQPFSQKDAFKLDQYIMNGGKVLWSMDAIGMHLDSMRTRNEFYPAPYDLGSLTDLFFRYGFRINEDLVQDLVNTRIPIAVSRVNGQPAIEKFPFPYHVLSLPNGPHPVIKNLDPIDLRFASSLDLSVEAPGDIGKTVLLTASDRARFQRFPSAIDLDMAKYKLELDRFNKPGLPIAALLEGTFTSPYANRMSAENLEVLREMGQEYRSTSIPNRMIIVSDGDWLVNSVTTNGEVRPLGYNTYEGYQYDNKTLALNMIEYLLDDQGVITARGKEVKLRMLNRDAAAAEAGFWRFLNIGFPLVFLALFGLLYNYLRRRKYARQVED
ncbi:MAG: gliding motility-associated ABC transporter substrate-binding protein GldG [Bacteroidota bacterium]